MKSYNGFTPAQRSEAGRWLRGEFKKGTLKRPTKCCACGQTEGRIDCHQEDYSKPYGPHLIETPLCFNCHMILHCRFRNREKWDQYRARLREGYRFKQSTSWRVFVNTFLEGEIDAVSVSPREGQGLTLLDEINAKEKEEGYAQTEV